MNKYITLLTLPVICLAGAAMQEDTNTRILRINNDRKYMNYPNHEEMMRDIGLEDKKPPILHRSPTCMEDDTDEEIWHLTIPPTQRYESDDDIWRLTIPPVQTMPAEPVAKVTEKTSIIKKAASTIKKVIGK